MSVTPDLMSAMKWHILRDLERKEAKRVQDAIEKRISLTVMQVASDGRKEQ